MRPPTSPTRLLATVASGCLVLLAACGDDAPPTAAADLVAVYPGEIVHNADEIVEAVEWPDGEGTLRSPHARLTLRSLSVAGAYAPGAHRDDAYHAAEGHELLVATFDTADMAPDPPAEAVEAMAWAVVVGERAEAVEPIGPGDSLVVSVPTGTEALLQVTDDGRTQSLSLRTGVRGPDAVPAMYEPQPSQDIHHTYTGSGVYALDDFGPTPVGVEIDLERAWRTVWYPGAGWAAPGRAWLVVEVTSGRLSTEDDYAWSVVTGMPIREGAFAVTTPDGATSSSVVEASTSGMSVEPARFVFDVPENTTTAVLAVDLGRASDSWVDAPSPSTVDLALAVG